ncbi:MAG TPA: zinc-binding dehydrogenase [Acidimicrobiales bacterium]|nr:zinc-binding dehydrogenase [Acidimicrobiales bacterium]
MLIVEVEAFGRPEVLVGREVPDLVAEPGQVVIDVAVVPVLFLDTQIRSGHASDWFPIKPPYVPGVGVAGRVATVGEDVDGSWVGRSVVAGTGGRGGYAEQAAVPADELIPIPDGLGVEEAAALQNDGRTALKLFEVAGVQPGGTVLVTAAAGGLGVLAVQLAHRAGARVVGAARGRPKLTVAGDAGAKVAVDYSEPGWARRALEATGGVGFDVVLDGVGGQLGREAFETVRPGGRFVGYGAPSGGFAAIDPEEPTRRQVAVFGIGAIQFEPAEGRRLTARALAEGAAGRLRPLIGQVFPLGAASEAHAAIEGRAVVGKTLLIV